MNHRNRPAELRYGVAAVLFCLYAAASTWIVRAEGESHRKDCRIERLLAEAAPSPTPRPTSPEVEPSRPSADEPPPTPAKPPVEEPPLAPATRAAPAPTVPYPAPIAVVDRGPEPPPAEVAPSAPIPASDPFWDLPAQKKVWDLSNLTIEDERQLGADLNRMILQFHKPLEAGSLPKRLEDAAEPFLASCTRKGISYTFTVLDCDESNAFSHPGGYVYVCRGLFDWIAEEDDNALEFIVAHEMAHVDLRHAIDCLRDPEVKKLKSGTVPLFYALVIPWGYKPEQDTEADRWAAQRMMRGGRSRHDTMAFLRKLEDYARKHGFENLRRKPGDDPELSPLDNHLRAHPIPRRRIKDLGTLLDPAPKPR
jgi:Peptidase family M48